MQQEVDRKEYNRVHRGTELLIATTFGSSVQRTAELDMQAQSQAANYEVSFPDTVSSYVKPFPNSNASPETSSELQQLRMPIIHH